MSEVQDNLIINSVHDLSKKLNESILKIIKREGYIEYTVQIENICTKNGSYFGKLYDVHVIGRTEDGEKETNIFVKSIIPTEECVKLVPVTQIYENEIFAYKELFPMLEKIQEKAKVPLQDRFKTVKCYEESDAQDIIMENITRKGFKTFNRFDIASLEFVEKCVKQLARYHGLSLVVKQKYPTLFDTKIKPLRHPFKFETSEWTSFIEAVKRTTMEYVDEDSYKQKVEKVYAHIASNKFFGYNTDENTMSVMCHGDYRTSNIMVRIQDGEIREMITLDYQVLFYGCPMYDIFYMLTFSTDRDFRKKHLIHLRDVYYETLQIFLKYFDIDLETVYSRKAYEKEFDEKRHWLLIILLCFGTFMFAAESDVDVINLTFEMDSGFKDRLRDVIEEQIELGYL